MRLFHDDDHEVKRDKKETAIYRNPRIRQRARARKLQRAPPRTWDCEKNDKGRCPQVSAALRQSENAAGVKICIELDFASNRLAKHWRKLLGDLAAVSAMLDRLRHGHVLRCGIQTVHPRTHAETVAWAPG
jgi:hypothetical protein